MKNTLLLILLFSISVGPTFSQSKSEKKKLKQEKAAQEFEETKTRIDSQTYSFVATWANTQKGRRINLTTNPNYLKIDQQKADIYLPYYGEVHMASSGLNDEGGIVFKGEIENYKVKYNDKKRTTVISFSAAGKSDKFDFTLTVFKSGGSNLVVYSNIRSSINYDGELRNLTIDK